MWSRALTFCFVLLSMRSTAFSDDQASSYRETYPCKEAGPTSTCIVGTIPPGAKLTLITKDQAVSAKTVRELPDQYFSSGRVTGTLLQAGKNLPANSEILAVLAPVSAISVIRQEERNDPALARRVDTYIEKMNRKVPVWKQLDHRWLNPHITTRVVGLTQHMSIAEVTVRFDGEAFGLDRKTIEVRYAQCEEERITLLARDDDVFELFDRGDTIWCSHLVSAFHMSGRIYLFTTANGCSNGDYRAQVQDVSGQVPRSVFSSSFFAD